MSKENPKILAGEFALLSMGRIVASEGAADFPNKDGEVYKICRAMLEFYKTFPEKPSHEQKMTMAMMAISVFDSFPDLADAPEARVWFTGLNHIVHAVSNGKPIMHLIHD